MLSCMQERTHEYILAPSERVVYGSRKAPAYSVATRSQGVNFLHSQARAAWRFIFNIASKLRVRSANHNRSQTLGHLAPGCKDEISQASSLLMTTSVKVRGLVVGFPGGRTLSMARKYENFEKKWKQVHGKKFEREFEKETYWKKYRVRAAFDVLCEAKTKEGKPCQNLAEPGARFCSVHGRNR